MNHINVTYQYDHSGYGLGGRHDYYNIYVDGVKAMTYTSSNGAPVTDEKIYSYIDSQFSPVLQYDSETSTLTFGLASSSSYHDNGDGEDSRSSDSILASVKLDSGANVSGDQTPSGHHDPCLRQKIQRPGPRGPEVYERAGVKGLSRHMLEVSAIPRSP